MSKKQESCKERDKILTALGKMLLIIWTVWWEGVKRLRGLSALVLFMVGWPPLFSFVLGYRYYHLRFFYRGDLMSLEMARGLVEWGRIPNGLALMGVVGGLVLFVLGFGAYCTKMRAARALSRLGIKVGMDCSPKLVKVAVLGEYRKRLTLLSEGVGINHYTKRAKDIEAVFNAKVESIKMGRMPRFVEITLGQVAKKLGISKSTVIKKLQGFGVSLRPKRGRMTIENNYRHHNPPYGYSVKKGVLAPNPQEVKVCRLIVNLIRDKGMGYSEVGRELGKKQIKNRKDKVKWGHSVIKVSLIDIRIIFRRCRDENSYRHFGVGHFFHRRFSRWQVRPQKNGPGASQSRRGHSKNDR